MAFGKIADVIAGTKILAIWGNEIRNRTVTPFLTNGDRVTGLPTAAQDGQLVYIDGPLAGDKELQCWDGSTWRPIDLAIPWTSYTPALTATGGSPAIGSATRYGRYKKIGKYVTAQVGVTVASDTNFGTGPFFFSLPLAGQASYPTQMNIGHAYAFDSSASRTLVGAVMANDANRVYFVGPDTVGAWTGPAVPFAWGNLDVVSFQVTYESAA